MLRDNLNGKIDLCSQEMSSNQKNIQIHRSASVKKTHWQVIYISGSKWTVSNWRFEVSSWQVWWGIPMVQWATEVVKEGQSVNWRQGHGGSKLINAHGGGSPQKSYSCTNCYRKAVRTDSASLRMGAAWTGQSTHADPCTGHVMGVRSVPWSNGSRWPGLMTPIFFHTMCMGRAGGSMGKRQSGGGSVTLRKPLVLLASIMWVFLRSTFYCSWILASYFKPKLTRSPQCWKMFEPIWNRPKGCYFPWRKFETPDFNLYKKKPQLSFNLKALLKIQVWPISPLGHAGSHRSD